MELNRLLLKFMLLYDVDFQQSSCKDNAKFNLVQFRREKVLGEFIFRVFREPKIGNFLDGGHHGATSGIYWVHYSKVETYAYGYLAYDLCSIA